MGDRIGAEDQGFRVAGEGELDAAGSGWLLGVGVGIGRRREFACVFARLFAGGEVADDYFAVAFEREEAVGEVVAVVGEDLAGDGLP